MELLPDTGRFTVPRTEEHEEFTHNASVIQLHVGVCGQDKETYLFHEGIVILIIIYVIMTLS